jgi:hypothetical protein
MTARAALLQLRDRLRSATGPDQSLDNGIFAGTRGLTWIEEPRGIRSGTIRWHDGSPTNVMSVPKYTESTDVALTTAPRKWRSWLLTSGRLAPDEPIYGARFFSDEAGDHEVAEAEHNASLALCICLARIEYEIARAA